MNRRVVARYFRILIFLLLVGLLPGLHLLSNPAAAAEPGGGDKNDPTQEVVEPGAGDFTSLAPRKDSKNGAVVRTPDNEAIDDQPASVEFDAKNGITASREESIVEMSAAELAGSGSLIACGAYSNVNWETASATFTEIRKCTLKVPQDGQVFISADANVVRKDGEYEGQFAISIDNLTGDVGTDRWVNVYNDTGDGTDEAVAISVLKPVTAGTHTYYFLGKRYSGSGTVLLYDPSLTVIFIPNGGEVRACGASGNLNWGTNLSTYTMMRSCSMTLPKNGYVFISADGSVVRDTSDYEASFRIGIDDIEGDPNIDRWVNVYSDAGDGTDKSVALSVLKPVTAGAHTFYSLGRRYSGSGNVIVYDPTLTVIYLPTPSHTAVSCGVSGNMDWTTTSSTFAPIRQCTLSVPQTGWVFVSANASLGRQDGDYEALFRIGVDSPSGDSGTDRWINIYADAGDGTDKSVAVSALTQVKSGVHKFYFLGRRYAGTGTVLAFDPTLTVIAPGAKLYLPMMRK